MRSTWRWLLLRRCFPRTSTHVSAHLNRSPVGSQLNLHTLRSLCSAFHSRAPHWLSSHAELFGDPPNSATRCFSSDSALESTDHAVLIDIFGKSLSDKKAKARLCSSKITLSDELMSRVFKDPNFSRDAASRILNFVLKFQSGSLTSESYNLMLGFLGNSGFVGEFWTLARTMRKKRYAISEDVLARVLEKFEKDGLEKDSDKLRGLRAAFSASNSLQNDSSRMYETIRSEEWSDDLERRLKDMNVSFSKDLIRIVLKKLSNEPEKALKFFGWIGASGLDERIYNVMAMTLARDGWVDGFWELLKQMKKAGYKLEAATYSRAFLHFMNRSRIYEAVRLYEFAMDGAEKRSVENCGSLLKMIAVNEVFDIDLALRVVKVFMKPGYVLKSDILGPLIQSLCSIGRIDKCILVLEAVQKLGFEVVTGFDGKMVYRLAKAGNGDAAIALMDSMEASGRRVKDGAWKGLITGLSMYGDLDRASEFYLRFLKKTGITSDASVFEKLMEGYCHQHKASDACELLFDHLHERKLSPSPATFKTLTDELLAQGSIKDAIRLLDLMSHCQSKALSGSFIEHVTKSGSPKDAVDFIGSLKLDRRESVSMYLCMFKECFRAGRHEKARDILVESPRYIKNGPDVLNLFSSSVSERGTSLSGVVA